MVSHHPTATEVPMHRWQRRGRQRVAGGAGQGGQGRQGRGGRALAAGGVAMLLRQPALALGSLDRALSAALHEPY